MGGLITSNLMPRMRPHADRVDVVHGDLAGIALDYTAALPVPALTGIGVRLDNAQQKGFPRRLYLPRELHVGGILHSSTAGAEAMTLRFYGLITLPSAFGRRWCLIQALNNGVAISAASQPGCVATNGTGNDIVYFEPVVVGAAYEAYTVLPVTAIVGTAAKVNTYVGMAEG